MADIREEVARTIRENDIFVGLNTALSAVDPFALADVLLNSFEIRPRYRLHGKCQALTRHQMQCLFEAQETVQGIGLCRTHATLKAAGRPVALANGEWS
jgi:hypothetical protein